MLIFLFTLFILLLFSLVLAWSASSRQTKSRIEIYSLIQRVLDHKPVLQEWEIFLVYPAQGDNELDVFRSKCRDLDAHYATGMEKAILTLEGEQKLKHLFMDFKQHGIIEF